MCGGGGGRGGGGGGAACRLLHKLVLRSKQLRLNLGLRADPLAQIVKRIQPSCFTCDMFRLSLCGERTNDLTADKLTRICRFSFRLVVWSQCFVSLIAVGWCFTPSQPVQLYQGQLFQGQFVSLNFLYQSIEPSYSQQQHITL